MAASGGAQNPLLGPQVHDPVHSSDADQVSTTITYSDAAPWESDRCSPRSDGGDKQLKSSATEYTVDRDSASDVPKAWDGQKRNRPKASWRPKWLRPLVLACFGGLFLGFSIALPVMLWYSTEHNGLAKTKQNFGYVWRFGPTGVLTIVAAFWARVESQTLRYMPWVTLSQGKTTDYDVDYMSMLSPVVLYQSLRRKHWMVLMVSVASLLIRAEIVLAPGLFNLSPVLERRPVEIQTMDYFNQTWASGEDSLGRKAYIVRYTARAIDDFEMQYPFGASKEVAYQTFRVTENGRRGTVDQPVRAQVDGFFTDIECRKIEGFRAGPMVNNTVTPGSWQYEHDLEYYFEGCWEPVKSAMTQVPALRPGAEWEYDLLPPSIPWASEQRPCSTLPQQKEQNLYVQLRYGASNRNSTTRLVREPELLEVHGVLCAATAWLSKVEVADDGVSPNVSILPNQVATPIDANVWKIANQANSGKTPIEVIPNLANATDINEVMRNASVNLMHRYGPLIGHYLLRQTEQTASVAEMQLSTYRLALTPQVCVPMLVVSLLIALIIVTTATFSSRRHTAIWHRDPATVLGNLLYFKQHPDTHRRILGDGPPVDSLKEAWSHCTFSPVVLRTWAQLAFTVFVAGVVVALGTTLRESQSHRGLAGVDETGYWYLLWTSLPALVMICIALYTSSTDAVLRGLATLHSLAVAPRSSRRHLDVSMMDMLGLRALLESGRRRMWTIATSQVMVLLCGFLTTLAAVLFNVETVPRETALRLPQQSWFGDRLNTTYSPDEVAQVQNLQSLVARRSEGNLTYPKHTYATLAFPAVDERIVLDSMGPGHPGVRMRLPAAKLTPSCERVPEGVWNVTVFNYTDVLNLAERETVYQALFFSNGTCENGMPWTFGGRHDVGRNTTSSTSQVTRFANLLNTLEDPKTLNQSCKIAPDTTGARRDASHWQTYVWGQFDHVKYDFDLLEIWKCRYNWWQVAVDVDMMRVGEELVVDQTNGPPREDEDSARPFSWAVDVPDYEKALPVVFVAEQTVNLIHDDLKALVEPYGTLKFEELGDARWVDKVLDEFNTNLAFMSAQILSLENRLAIGQDSRTAPFPGAAELPDVEVVVTDRSQRRLVQNATVTYIVIGILGFVAAVNVWTAVSGAARRFGLRSKLLSMDVRGVAPDRFGSQEAMAGLLWGSNAMQRAPGGETKTEEVHGKLDGMRFAMGWFRGDGEERCFTVGVVGDEKFEYEDGVKGERKDVYERVEGGEDERGLK
ncbi:hypothetical protein Cob_v004845 [Colletotrichum orbiculare MAFF 240422]|uniref:Uncharacterized protein n=1 Tax=Colletotrichum orbiculare (strain 104-T / ATCC 96160 / CBS 514.97 / LARS 414 / MAFF 240422) TaxID=1213857 RepID=N4V6G4_COLOR|nr:hypothetical protein Cob_v004845 [Colletotrichum orbiculare MAFF 240422]